MSKIEDMAIKGPMSAYDLLDEVARLADEEPRRINIKHWRLTRSAVHATGGVPDRLQVEWPDCGTIGCIAGWCSVLLGIEDAVALYDYDPVPRALKLDLGQTRDLFMPPDLIYRGKPAGTREHADEVIDHIRKFQRDNEAQLRGTTVYPQQEAAQ